MREICKYLTISDIKSLRTVDKVWNHVSTLELTRRAALRLNIRCGKNEITLMRLARLEEEFHRLANIQTVHVKLIWDADFEIYGRHVVGPYFNQVCNSLKNSFLKPRRLYLDFAIKVPQDMEFVKIILKKFSPDLEEIHLIFNSIGEGKRTVKGLFFLDTDIGFPKLTKLCIPKLLDSQVDMDIGERFLRSIFIGSPQIKEIKVGDLGSRFSDKCSVLEALKNSDGSRNQLLPNLTAFDLDSGNRFLKEFPQNFTRLAVNHCDSYELITKNAQTLESLVVYEYFDEDQRIIRPIPSCPVLKELEVNMAEVVPTFVVEGPVELGVNYAEKFSTLTTLRIKATHNLELAIHIFFNPSGNQTCPTLNILEVPISIMTIPPFGNLLL